MNQPSFQRTSLSEQVVALLKERIGAGFYGAFLPGEFEMASEMNVARGTIRAALKTLTATGWLEKGRPGKSRMIHKRHHSRTVRRKWRIGFLTPRPLQTLGGDDLAQLMEFQKRCVDSGWECAFHPAHLITPQNLDTLITRHPVDLWIGYCPVFVLQKIHRAGIPIIGWNRILPPEESFGGITYDYHSARVHALNVLLRAGRRRIVFPSAVRHFEFSQKMKTLYEERGLIYEEAFHYPVFEYSRTGFLRLMERLFRRPDRPDGLILIYTVNVQAVLLQGWLAEHGLSFPKDLSVIQLGWSNFLDLMHPSVAYYKASDKQFTARMLQAARHFFETGELLRKKILIPMEFVRGESI